MKFIIGITFPCISVYMTYIIYNDRNAEKYKCKKIAIIDYVVLWLGLFVTIIAGIVTRTTVYIDWLYFLVSTVITIGIFWSLLLKDFYIDLKKLDKDVLPYNIEQRKQIGKTYIRNGSFLTFYIIQIIILAMIFN